jgi:hypothetical protein
VQQHQETRKGSLKSEATQNSQKTKEKSKIMGSRHKKQKRQNGRGDEEEDRKRQRKPLEGKESGAGREAAGHEREFDVAGV